MPEMDVNQGLRYVEKLASLEDGRTLVQYEMPGDTTALRALNSGVWEQICAGITWVYPWQYKNVSYGNIPMYWVRAIFEEGSWKDVYFNPQQVRWEKAQKYEERFLAQIAKVQEQDFLKQLTEETK